MLFTIISSAIANPAVNLDIWPLNENHPAVMHEYTPAESFASSAGVLRDIQQLESFAGQSFERNWFKLPKSNKIKRNIWPGPYWPTNEDGINARWAGEDSLSPVEKYAKAFGLDANVLANAVSRKSGIDSLSSLAKCTKDSDCYRLKCAVRRGQTEGRCIPSWFGICHAWAPVSIVEDEPMKAVTVNGVTFEPMDIKALVTQIYDMVRFLLGKDAILNVLTKIFMGDMRPKSAVIFHLISFILLSQTTWEDSKSLLLLICFLIIKSGIIQQSVTQFWNKRK
jgi:hypothetical protein